MVRLNTIETFGLFGIMFGFVGTLFQLKKTYKTRSTESFSILYLILVTMSESFFMFQGVFQRSPTYILSKASAALYFLFLLAVAIEEKETQHKELKY